MNIAFREIARVLKPGGKFIIFTATPAQMKSYWLNHYFPQMMAGSGEEMPTFDAIKATLSRVNFSIESIQPFFIGPELQDFFLYSGKQRPEMYLSRPVRNGISSFHKFCSNTELTSGLDKLRKDIESGTIKEILQKYDSEIGDYLFVSALKWVGDK
jgi:ubiquinone/menaquinone biosynthesis C-methylase UbiE